MEEATRDMAPSGFCGILSRLAATAPGVQAAIFFDGLGETIDYYSCLDPYLTRLMGAHHGIIYGHVATTLAWLRLGVVEMVEIRSAERTTLTVPVGEDCFLTVVVDGAELDAAFLDALVGCVAELKQEVGY